jgi:hypothetical protein
MIIDFLKIISESDKHPNLKTLFGEATEKESNAQKLREFVRIMLDLKHHSIVKEFLEIYEVIVGEVIGTKFESVRRPT